MRQLGLQGSVVFFSTYPLVTLRSFAGGAGWERTRRTVLPFLGL